MIIRKKPIDLIAQIAEEDGICLTLEGTMSYKAGDVLIIGVKGETYPIRRDIFDATYDVCQCPEAGCTIHEVAG